MAWGRVARIVAGSDTPMKKRMVMQGKNTMMWVMASALMLASNVRSEAPCEVEVRAILNNILDTEYCGTSGFGPRTAIRGLSPVPGQGFVSLEEGDWGPVLLEMAEAELERCKTATVEALEEYRRANEVFADGKMLHKSMEEQSKASGAVNKAENKLLNETRRLHKMLSLLGLMDGEREEVVRLIGRIAKECPIEFNLHREANGAWICQTMKDGDVEKCLELGKWYRAHKGKGSEEEIDFCRQAVADVLHNCTSQEQYGMVARYVLEAMDGCGNYPQCNQFDAVASERLSGWLGSVQRRRMAERFLDWQPFRLSHINKDTGVVEYDEPTPEAVAQLLRSRAAAELAADEKDLTDLREVYGAWEEDNVGDTKSPLTEP